MTRSEQKLEELNKEALIEWVNLLLGRVARLERQVEQLRGQIKGEKGVKKTSENSSKPPSQEPKAKRGPKFGQAGKSRKRVIAAEIIASRVAACLECGDSLEAAKQWLVGSHQVVDIAPIKPIVREARRYRGYSPHGKTRRTVSVCAIAWSNIDRLTCYFCTARMSRRPTPPLSKLYATA